MKTIALAVLLACGVSAQAEPGAMTGKFALQGDTAKTNGYLKLTPIGGNPLKEHMDIWMTEPNSSVAIKNYLVEMTKKVHVVIVSDDFKTFLHVHPTLNANGHFLLDQPFPAAGNYQIYADGEPNNLNHQVFRFEVTIGPKPMPATPVITPTGLGVTVGPYEVDLSSLKLRAGNVDMIDVEILKDGKPAKDLHPYLGAPAHAVFLNQKDLSYVHVHPMAMDMMEMDMSKPMPDMPDSAAVANEMMLHIGLREPGTYKMWLQFRGAGDKLYVAEFTIVAS